MANFRNRIVEYGVKRADQFTPHPENLKIHPEWQRQTLGAFLDDIGWIGVVVESKRSGYLIDGHERVWQALPNNEEVPYIVVDLTEEEEARALLKFDYIGGMAQYDKERTAALLSKAQTNNITLQKMMTEMAAKFKIQPSLTMPSLPSRSTGAGEPREPEGSSDPQGERSNAPTDTSASNAASQTAAESESLPFSAIRQVQLFFPPDEYEQFLTLLQAVKARFGAKNNTDAVMEAVRYAHAHAS